ncbi:MAG TPA: hypothetical protein VKM93_04565 [Terriglobia bacterium]|nr:hypothetical protein [Terriglobia bacterium]
MSIAQTAVYFVGDNPFTWRADWAWGLPLIVLTVLIHVSGLLLISQRVVHGAGPVIERRHPKLAFVVVLCSTTLLATCLHGLEATIWAFAYQFLGALPDYRSSVLYSLNAMTSYGHTNLALEDRWHLLGAMEALNGWLLFGLTAAFLFAVLEKVWLLRGAKEHR